MKKSITRAVLQKQGLTRPEIETLVKHISACIARNVNFSLKFVRDWMNGIQGFTKEETEVCAIEEIECMKRVLLWKGYSLKGVPKSSVQRAKKYIPLKFAFYMDPRETESIPRQPEEADGVTFDIERRTAANPVWQAFGVAEAKFPAAASPSFFFNVPFAMEYTVTWFLDTEIDSVIDVNPFFHLSEAGEEWRFWLLGLNGERREGYIPGVVSSDGVRVMGYSEKPETGPWSRGKFRMLQIPAPESIGL